MLTIFLFFHLPFPDPPIPKEQLNMAQPEAALNKIILNF